MSILIPEKLIQTLRQAQSVTVLTGAGTSAESGVPTFRDALTGLWANFDPQELATPQAFQRNPRLVWEWYASRRGMIAEAKPNPGHVALAEMATHFPTFTLITQNVDGLHQQAGSQNVIELHGNIQRTKCFDCDQIVDKWVENDETPPRCPHCAGLLRPDVVWFGEGLPYAAMQKAFEAARQCDLFLSIGTSSLVQPAASLPVEAIKNGIPAVEINPESTPITGYMSYVLSGASGTILPALLECLL